jgi:hypothetical protein
VIQPLALGGRLVAVTRHARIGIRTLVASAAPESFGRARGRPGSPTAEADGSGHLSGSCRHTCRVVR